MQKGPTREPRSWLANPREFGISRDPEWVEAIGEVHRAQLRAAQLQHRISRLVRAELQRQGLNLQTFAHGKAISYQQLGKVLRGQANMTMLHVAVFELGLKKAILVGG